MSEAIHGYKGYFNGRETDVYAPSLYAAKLKAVEFFKPAKSKQHLVHVHLCELNVDPATGKGEQVIHRAVD